MNKNEIPGRPAPTVAQPLRQLELVLGHLEQAALHQTIAASLIANSGLMLMWSPLVTLHAALHTAISSADATDDDRRHLLAATFLALTEYASRVEDCLVRNAPLEGWTLQDYQEITNSAAKLSTPQAEEPDVRRPDDAPADAGPEPVEPADPEDRPHRD